ncbi:MAG: glycerol-3-phosphate 1-O-acyltransferase PlsY [Armatimonadota bacterium]|nr:glycerol-3-phosphate 1-O-acyltransferase PlsY [Armatimonadota bacterium]
MDEAITLVASYLLGAVPFGLIIAKAWRGIDIRKVGSGNIGATNVYRTLGLAPGITVFIADVLKGLIPTVMAIRLFDQPWVAVAAGLSAIIGHSLSVFLKFKGGKGVATSLGVAIGLAPLIALIAFGIWVAIVLVTRYVSVASIIAVLSVPPLMWAFGKPLEYKLFALLVAIFVVVKHRSNIIRLIQGRELRFVKHNEKTEEQNG